MFLERKIRLLYPDQFAKYDVYKIDGQTDVRRFFIMHVYEDYRTASGWWSERSIGQLTVAQDGSMVIGTVSTVICEYREIHY